MILILLSVLVCTESCSNSTRMTEKRKNDDTGYCCL